MFDHKVIDPFIGFNIFSRDSPHFTSIINLAKVCENFTSKMELTKYGVSMLKRRLKDHGVRGYSGKRKAELIAMLQVMPAVLAQPSHPPSLPHPAR